MGHLKTILILAGGFWFFDHGVSVKKLLGSCIALGMSSVCPAFCTLTQCVVGCISYGYFKNEDLRDSNLSQPKERPSDAAK